MERKLNAELWDKMHYLFRDFNDRMVHAELHYDFEVNLEALKTVLICMLEKAPVLHSSFTDNRISPYWKVEDYHIDEVVHAYHIDESELKDRVNDFLVQYIPPEAKLQIQVAVFYYNGKTAICIVENHMCMDGGDFKYFLKTMCKNYTDYVEKHISPIELKTGSRAYTQVYEDFSKTEQKMAKNLYRNINSADDHGFPFTADNLRDKSFIARRKFPATTFEQLRASGKKRGATINDMLLTAYFYSLYQLAGFDSSESVSISCAIDLRRHIKNSDENGITNHTAWMQCKVPQRGNNIFETLEYVMRSSNQFKEDRFMGLHGLPLLSFGYKIMPLAASEEVIKIGYANPLLAMSNIGILEVDKLSLSGNEPIDGFMSGAVKYKPFALLSATTMRKEITLSMCVRGNEQDEKIVENFFDLMAQNINNLING